jgi:hypothetical protein
MIYKTGQIGALSRGEIYELLEAGRFEEETQDDIDDYYDIKRLGLHKIVTRPTILPYYDM